MCLFVGMTLYGVQLLLLQVWKGKHFYCAWHTVYILHCRATYTAIQKTKERELNLIEVISTLEHMIAITHSFLYVNLT